MTTAGPVTTASVVRVQPRRRGSRRPSAWHLVLLPVALIMLAPLIWMLVTSVSTLAESRHFPPRLPSSIHWENYREALTAAPFGRWLVNSTVVSAACVLSNLVFCSLAAYAFARMRFRGSNVAFVLMLATLMVPFQVVMIPTLLVMKDLHLVDSLAALALPNLATPFGVFLLRQFFLSMPQDIEEAAKVDGAGRLRTLFQIVLPLMGPPLATLSVLTFLNVWNDFLWPLIVIQTPSHMTLQLGLASLQGDHLTKYPLLMAASLMSQLPVLLAFLLAQRFFIRSIATSGIK
ncbi:carbohydrate ABC transporter permease [Acidothermaceae bacterium B102]|nr:carbohydrate ABC transporter permease [Acidothermaceae bacterium B102]